MTEKWWLPTYLTVPPEPTPQGFLNEQCSTISLAVETLVLVTFAEDIARKSVYKWIMDASKKKMYLNQWYGFGPAADWLTALDQQVIPYLYDVMMQEFDTPMTLDRFRVNVFSSLFIRTSGQYRKLLVKV